ncbi:MAG: O-antigen ligase family protein [Candidatus Hodarchaeota archaeon]
MSPPIALLICILFILYLYRIDFKRKPDVSHALWIPLIWMLIIGSRFVSQWLNIGTQLKSPDDYLEGSAIDRMVFMILIMSGLLILSRRKVNWSQILQNNKLIVIFFLYCGFSIVWSDFPFVSLKRWVKAIGDLIMILVVLTDRDPIEAVKTTVRRCAYVLIPLSILFIKYYSYLGRSYSRAGEPLYNGVATTKNSLGILCAISGILIFWDLLTIWKRRNLQDVKKEIVIDMMFLVMVSWLLRIANSATSLVCSIIGVLILIVIRLPFVKRNLRNFGVLVLFAISFFLILQLSFDVVGLSISVLGRDPTLTERVPLWKELVNMDTDPLIGTGFESFWLGDRAKQLWRTWVWGINQAHNGYLEIYLNLGLIGLFLLIGVVVSAYKKIRNGLISEFHYASLQIAFLVIAVLYNVTEALFRELNLVSFVFFLIAVEIPRKSESELGASNQNIR